MAGPRTQRKTKVVVKTFKDHGPYIVGDPGAVSRVGRKGGTKVFKYRRKSPWVPTLIELFPKIQADAGSWLGTKNALYYYAQSANSFFWVFFVSSYTTAIVLPHLPGSFTKLVRARETLKENCFVEDVKEVELRSRLVIFLDTVVHLADYWWRN